MRIFLLAILLSLANATANAFCFEPSAPSGPWSSQPSAPYCGGYGDLSDCSQWEVDAFRAEVEEYIARMQEFADDATEYANDALEYANCEAQAAINEWNTFIGR